MSEKLTPRQAGEQSAQNYKEHRLAVAALDQVHDVIGRSAHDAENTELDDMRRASSQWHVQWWTERRLPEAQKHLDTVNQKADRDFQENQESYYQAAVAEALLDNQS